MHYGEQSVFEFNSHGEASHLIDSNNINFVEIPDPHSIIRAEDIDEQPQKGPQESKDKGKKKAIAKTCKCQTKTKKYEKRKKDASIKVDFGRPENRDVEGVHLKENKSYNDIVYHFSRFLIFLKLKQGSDKSTHVLDLTSEQNKWISEVEAVMETDNFPRFQDPKPHFLLHPNSPHFAFNHYKKREEKSVYSSEEVQLIMIAYLRRKGLLTPTIYHYVNDYWRDIVYLVNNPRGEMGDDIPQDDSLLSGEAVEMQNENVQTDNRRRESESEQVRALPENRLLAMELQADESIAAYEIACYLHACCEKYELKID